MYKRRSRGMADRRSDIQALTDLFPQCNFLFLLSGSHLSSHTVASIVLSAALVLTVVFGMGTGVSPERIATGNFLLCNVRAADCSLTATDLRRLLLGHALIQILSAVCISEQAHMHTSVKISALTLTTR